MARKTKVEVDEEMMRRMIAGLVPQTTDITREVAVPPEVQEPEHEAGKIGRAECPARSTAAKPATEASAPENAAPGASPDSRRRRSIVLPDYERTFLVPADYDVRASLYVSAETKRTILDIARKIGGRRLTATSFVDNILRHHIAVFRDDINRLYKARNQETLV